MLLDSDAKLTKPQCLLITGAVRNGICRPMGIHTHSCCGKETTTEATMSLASWAQNTAAPTGKQGPSVSTYLLTIHRELLGHSTNLIPGARILETQVLIEYLSCACSPTAMEGVRRSQGLSQRSDIHGNYTHSTSGYSRRWKTSSENSWKHFNTFTWEWLGASLMVTQKKKEMDLFSVIPDNNNERILPQH